MDELVLPDVACHEAVQGYVTQFGEMPNARRLGLFLADYGVVAPATGGVLTEGQLRPILQDFKMQIPNSRPYRQMSRRSRPGNSR
ncbi:hypothetical protein [Streptomyces sp. NPDC053726]|uniref:hypothetical protein n=1 Tax=Streptomyces sp. NPDC053726 TaxID=3365713 RepID=UPI0037CEE817